MKKRGGKRPGAGRKKDPSTNSENWKVSVSGKVPRHLKETLSVEAAENSLSMSAMLESVLMDRYVNGGGNLTAMSEIEELVKEAVRIMVRKPNHVNDEVFGIVASIHETAARAMAGGHLPGEPVHPPCPEVTEGLKEIVLGFVPRVQPEAGAGALVPLRALRFATGIKDREFDAAIMALAGDGRIFLHRHVHPYRLKDEDKEQLVTDGHGNYYVGFALRE